MFNIFNDLNVFLIIKLIIILPIYYFLAKSQIVSKSHALIMEDVIKAKETGVLIDKRIRLNNYTSNIQKYILQRILWYLVIYLVYVYMVLKIHYKEEFSSLFVYGVGLVLFFSTIYLIFCFIKYQKIKRSFYDR